MQTKSKFPLPAAAAGALVLFVTFSLPAAAPPATLSATAAGAGVVLASVPMQGPMVHVNIEYAASGGSPLLRVHVDASVPVLTPLVVSEPGALFDPAHPWHPELDPTQGGAAFNRQYGFVMGGASEPLPDGHGIRIRQALASPELWVRRYRQTPPTWEPMFGQGGSPEIFEWNLLMFHPAYAVAPWVPGPLTATYEAWVVDATGQPTTAPTSFTLTWEVARGLLLAPPTFRDGKVEIPFTTPATWSGFSYELERCTALGGTWTGIAAILDRPPGQWTLRDDAPPVGGALYRVRSWKP
jgi:hypothetical protein